MTHPFILLKHMTDCIELSEAEYAAQEQALADPRSRSVMLYNLQIMAQSALRLPAELQARHTEINWAGLRGFRNILVHDYLGLDLTHVESLVLTALPKLKQAALAELAAIPPDEIKRLLES